MLHHRATYDAIESGEQANEATFLTASVAAEEAQHADASSRGGLDKKRAVLLSLLLIAAVTMFASEQSLYSSLGHVPLIGASMRKLQAQSIADEVRSKYLTTSRQLYNEEGHHHFHKNEVSKQAPDGCEATVVIVRHCEKGSIREHCSHVGYERSVFLTTIFGDNDERWPAPSFIYALRPGQRHNPKKRNYRELETVMPLATKANVTINDSYDTHHAFALAQNVTSKLQRGEICGKVVVIAWKHSDIPHLAHKFGCGPSEGCPADYPSATFDQAWQIKFVYQKLRHSEKKNGKIPKHDVWEVYGSVQDEGFDPLAFSKQMGDYTGGSKLHAKWSKLVMEVPEEGIPYHEQVTV